MLKLSAVTLMVLASVVFSVNGLDKPCIGRKYNHTSIVCVCNATYCDEVSKVVSLSSGNYVLYSSSDAGLRFHKTVGVIKSYSATSFLKRIFTSFGNILKSNDNVEIEINRAKLYQTVRGFGGSFTDSSGINVKLLSLGAQENILKSYFSDKGIEYNIGRVPIGGTDFSTRIYAYNSIPADDVNLSNFSLEVEDFKYKIPLMKRAQELATDELQVMASVWSPPAWMKTKGSINDTGILIKKYWQTYADYHVKFLQEYKKNGVHIWALTTGNEPSIGYIPVIAVNNLGWLPKSQAQWIVENFGPTIRNNPEFSNTHIIICDDQRLALPWWIQLMAKNPNLLKYVDGIGVHWYTDDANSPYRIALTNYIFPDKYLIGTEACVGDKKWIKERVALGNWERVEIYLSDIFENLNFGYVGWIDWNLVLNREGGPNWYHNYVDAPIISMPDQDEFLKQPVFYGFGHLSKFVPRGSRRVEVRKRIGTKRHINYVTFLRPDNGIVIVYYNPTKYEKILTIKEKLKGEITVKVPPKSVHSLIYW